MRANEFTLCKPLIVAGIGTEVGKTIVSAILVKALDADYWKPVQCGEDHPSDKSTVTSLVDSTTLICHAEAYSFKAPLSPHKAAKLENREIDLSHIKLPNTRNPIIIECAGGLFVPYADHLLQIDVMQTLNCPWILVSRHYLGSINHTLMSIEILRSRHCKLAGIIFNGTDTFGAEEIIVKQTNVPILGHLSEEPLIHCKNQSKSIINRYSNEWKPQLSTIYN